MGFLEIQFTQTLFLLAVTDTPTAGGRSDDQREVPWPGPADWAA